MRILVPKYFVFLFFMLFFPRVAFSVSTVGQFFYAGAKALELPTEFTGDVLHHVTNNYFEKGLDKNETFFKKDLLHHLSTGKKLWKKPTNCSTTMVEDDECKQKFNKTILAGFFGRLVATGALLFLSAHVWNKSSSAFQKAAGGLFFLPGFIGFKNAFYWYRPVIKTFFWKKSETGKYFFAQTKYESLCAFGSAMLGSFYILHRVR